MKHTATETYSHPVVLDLLGPVILICTLYLCTSFTATACFGVFESQTTCGDMRCQSIHICGLSWRFMSPLEQINLDSRSWRRSADNLALPYKIHKFLLTRLNEYFFSFHNIYFTIRPIIISVHGFKLSTCCDIDSIHWEVTRSHTRLPVCIQWYRRSYTSIWQVVQYHA